MTLKIVHDPVNDDDWMDHSACLGVDPDIFFPERFGSTTEAKAICAACSVRSECLEYAMTHSVKWGVWGGTTEGERRRIRRERRSVA